MGQANSNIERYNFERYLDKLDLARLEYECKSVLHGYEDEPRSTFSKGRKALNLSLEALENAAVYNICEEEN